VKFYSLLSAAGPSALSIWRLDSPPADLLHLFGLESFPATQQATLLSVGGKRTFDQGLFWYQGGDEHLVSAELHLHGGSGVAAAFRDWARNHGWQEKASEFNEKQDHCPGLASAQSPLAARFLAQLSELTWANELSQLSGYSKQQRLARLDEWVARLAWASILACPPRVALFGPTNAGKSTLFNSWVASQRATVSPSPGTTRDTVEARIQIGQGPDSWVCRLLDTAGVDSSLSGADAKAQAIAQESARTAWRRIWVFDAATEPTTDFLRMALDSSPADIFLVNRGDLAAQWRYQDFFGARKAISGSIHLDPQMLLEELESNLLSSLPPLPKPGSCLPFGSERLTALLDVFPELASHAVQR
jgi:hypothetical protein